MVSFILSSMKQSTSTLEFRTQKLNLKLDLKLELEMEMDEIRHIFVDTCIAIVAYVADI